MAATWPPKITVELFYDGVWNDITPDVRLTADIDMVVGRRNEGATAADPGKATFTLNNGRSRVNPGVSGRYSPQNPRSDLFGKIGKNSRVRVRVDDEPATPVPFVVDTFERSETSGWGDADTGQTWFIQETWDNGVNDSDYSVSDGQGHMLSDSLNPTGFRAMQLPLTEAKADVDMACQATIDQKSIDSSGLQANFAFLGGRVNSDASNFIGGAIWFAADSGLPNGQGLRVATSVISVVDFANAEEVQGTVIPGLTYTPGELLNMRFQLAGNEARMRVWPVGENEPSIWHSQAYITLVTDPGDVMILTQTSADGGTPPVTISYDNFSVSDPAEEDYAVRGVFEIYEWPARWDISDSDQWVPVVSNGILRRLNQGAQPIKSALRRYLASVFPVAYWPLEDTGFLGRFGVEAVAGGQSLSIAGIKFAEDDEVPGSEPLPELQESTGFRSPGIGFGPFMRSGEVAAIDTGSWSAWMLVRLPTDDFPTSGQHDLLKVYSSGTGVAWLISAEQSGGGPALRGRVFNEDSTVIGNALAEETASLAANGPRLTDDWRLICFRVNQNGGDVDWRFDWFTLDGADNWGNGSSFTGDAGHFTRVSTAMSPDLAGMRFGHLSAFGQRDPVGYFDTLTELHPALGFLGEQARERARRVMTEENTVIRIDGDADTPMGPQMVATANELVLEAATADIAILTEQRGESGLYFRARELMYNQDPVLILDYSNGEVFAPFEPTDDDQRINNAITVTREGGASATATQTDGPLNVNSPVVDPDGVGEYPASFTINVESDDQLDGYAGWRLHLGTVDELRYPRLSVNLANERIQPFIDQILQVREGAKIVIINPPDWLPSDDIELIVEGYQEKLNAFKWEFTFVCSPASPWTIGETAEEETTTEDFEDDTFVFDFTDGGDLPWTRDNTQANSGSWSMRSGAITNNQTSDLVLTLPDEAQRMTVAYMTSSEESGVGFTGDFLSVLADGDEVLRAQGITPWTEFELDVRPYSQITFRYTKDNSVADNDDTVWIDDLSVSVLTEAGTDEPNRADTTESRLLFSRTADDEELFVETVFDPEDATTRRATWVNSLGPDEPGLSPDQTSVWPEEFPFDVRLSPRGGSSGEVVQVDDVQPWGWDTFTRVEVDQWGNLDSGEAWVPAGGVASDRSVNGSGGIITLQANPSTIRFQQLLNSIADTEILLTMSPQQVSTGASMIPGVLLRASGDYYRARVHFGTSGEMFASVTRVVTAIGSTPSLPWMYAADDVFWVRVRIVDQRVLMRVWPETTDEPTIWHIDRTVETDPIASGAVGVTCSAFGGNTNVNPSITYDNFQVVTPQSFTVVRGVNEITRAWDAGTDVRLARPAIVAL